MDILDFCKARFTTSKEYFIKVTGSSKTLAPHKIEKLAKYGVYQLDMGAQSFDNQIRKFLCLPDQQNTWKRQSKPRVNWVSVSALI
jgi:coproporphyrinogen III oxidase-like Fe-S oxidoreductase